MKNWRRQNGLLVPREPELVCSMFGLGMGLGVGGSGTPFSPLDLSPVLWLRADLGITIATGVSAWADQSGTGDSNKNAVQGTGSAQPTRNATDAAYNNQSTLSFAAASSQALVSGDWTVDPPAPSTVFVVGNTSGAGGAEAFFDSRDSARYLLYKTGAPTSVDAFKSASLNASATTSSPQVYAVEFNGASSKVYVSSLTAAATGDTGSSSPTGMTLGSTYAASAFLNGKIAEVLVYSGVLSAGDRTLVTNYLGQRYGITIS